MKNTVIAIIADELGLQEADVTLDSSLVSLGADSLEIAEISLELESKLAIDISKADWMTLTVGQIEKMVMPQ